VKRLALVSTILGVFSSSIGCTFLSKSTEYNGLPSPQGKAVQFYAATNVGMELVFFLPILGDPTVTSTLGALTAKVKEDAGVNVRVVSTGTTYFWYLLFPFTLIFVPTATSVTAEAEFDGPPSIEKKATPVPSSAKGQPATKSGGKK
jgi:hypothetical protein